MPHLLKSAARSGTQGRHTSLRQQAGQTLLMAVGLLLAGGVGLYAMFSTGQMAAAKQRLVDSADAAAWSAGLWRARVLNYHAYSNRAILANEVAVAQAVTLVAWARYFETLSRNTASLGTLLPAMEPVLSGVAQAAALARQSAELAAQMEIPARAAEAVGYKEILQVSQEILHLSSQAFALNMVTAEVARASDASHFAWVLPDPGQSWQQFTHRADSQSDRTRFASLVVDSLDSFVSGPRSEDLLTPIPSLCLNLMRLRKRGATSLSQDLDRWEAVDTLSFHLKTLSWFKCRENEAVPLGWGAAQAGLPTQTLSTDAGELSLNPKAAQLASSPLFSEASYAGIARVRELDYERLANTHFPTSGLAVIARQQTEPAATSGNAGLAAGRMRLLELLPRAQGGRLWALSAAEVYFSRPVTGPQRLEYASLFNPYWQVRLVSPTPAQRLAALAIAQ